MIKVLGALPINIVNVDDVFALIKAIFCGFSSRNLRANSFLGLSIQPHTRLWTDE